jgi:fused signal recognition particle receptor
MFKRDKAENRKRNRHGVERSRQHWFGRIPELLRSRHLDDSVWQELEEILISSDVGLETSIGLIQGLKSRLKEARITEPEQVLESLKLEIVSNLDPDCDSAVGMLEVDGASPFVILMVGVNGAGKTTSIAKLAYHFHQAGQRVILGAGDTFRAAATEQLEILGERIGIEVISHRPGADPGAVAYDAYNASKARGADVLIIDTAGRLHTKYNLMEELKKIRRVLSRLDPAVPHQIILALDATTGYNGLVQARAFNEAVGCTGVFLAKLDGTARGGIVLAIRQELNIPILFIGTGEDLDDFAQFDAREFVEDLLMPVV